MQHLCLLQNNNTHFLRLITLLTISLTLSLLSIGRALADETQQIKTSDLSFSYASTNELQISYAQSGDQSKPGVLFIHGTPGGWEAFEEYLSNKVLGGDFFLVSVDRLGWGNSPIPPSEINGNFAQQSAGIGAILNKYPNKQWIIVGHSLGASIAPQVAMDYPANVSGLLLLAGSLKPSLGSPRWYNYAASTWVVASLIGSSMKYSNREIMSLKKELKKMDARIKKGKSEAKLVIMQGMKDKLVSPKNPAYAMSEWAPHFASIKLIELENEGHFLPWRQTELVIQSIYQINKANPIQQQ